MHVPVISCITLSWEELAKPQVQVCRTVVCFCARHGMTVWMECAAGRQWWCSRCHCAWQPSARPHRYHASHHCAALDCAAVVPVPFPLACPSPLLPSPFACQHPFMVPFDQCGSHLPSCCLVAIFLRACITACPTLVFDHSQAGAEMTAASCHAALYDAVQCIKH